MLGLLFGGMFLAVVLSYGCTEYQLKRLDALKRVMSGQDFPLRVILSANAVSFALVCTSALVFIAASGTELYLQAAAVCALAQMPWLGQHLWFYYRNHPRLRYEN